MVGAKGHADDFAVAVPNLDRGVLRQRIEEQWHRRRVDRIQAQPAALDGGLRSKHQRADAERCRLPAASWVLEVDEAGARVVLAVAAGLRRRRR